MTTDDAKVNARSPTISEKSRRAYESQPCHGARLKAGTMTAPILALAIFCIIAISSQIVSVLIAILRLWPNSRGEAALTQHFPPVSLVRPLCGLDNYAADTLGSTFALDYPHYEILFCVAAASDPAVPLVRELIAAHESTKARLLIGDDRVSSNPKLNNVVKGWRAARHDWIVLADSNVLMPPGYLRQLFRSWRANTGLVAAPPVGGCAQVPQHLSGALAIRHRQLRPRFCPGENHAVAPCRSRARRRHRGARQ